MTSNFEMPTRELHARFVQNGLTSSSYEDLAVMVTEIESISTEFETVLQQALPIIEPYDDPVLSGNFISEASKEMQAIYTFCQMDRPQFTKNRRDLYPLTNWSKDIAKYRMAIKKVRKAL